MPRAVPSSSSNRLRRLAIIAPLLSGCATSAPTLPADTTSIDRQSTVALSDFPAKDQAMSCQDIAAERQMIENGKAAANSEIEGNRTRNQVAGYLGGLYVLPLLATENNTAEKDKIAVLYQRQDTLIRLAAVKHCPSTP